MKICRRSFTLLLCLIAPPFAVYALEPGPAEAIRIMVESERSFYRTGQEKGTRAAFLAFLAEDGLVFRPGPVNGKGVWEKRAETGLDLIWEPTFAAIARSADFGYTTGPAKWRANKNEERFLGYGQFISIWKKQTDGSWKVALDCGMENPEPTGQPDPLRLSIPGEGSVPRAPLGASRKALQQAQRIFAAAAKTNSSEAVLGNAADEIRVYRDGSFPAAGKNTASALLKKKEGKMSIEPMGTEMSRSADLAYGYGKYSLNHNGNAEAGHFFQIWQIDSAGAWKLVLDWQQALPKEKP